MAPRQGYVPKNSLWLNRLVKLTYGRWVERHYRVRHLGNDFLRDLSPPYVVVGNHVTTRDPFILSTAIPEPVYWVTSDGNLRTALMRFVLSRLGSIPKSKAIPDVDTIRWILEIINGRRGVVGVFPEGQQSWDGHTLPLVPSTAKLLRLLRVPVVAAVIEGGYHSLPRWAWRRRPGALTVRWSLLIGPEEAGKLGAKDLGRRLEAALDYDEYEALAASPVLFESSTRAEHVELALFLCPRCGAEGRLESSGQGLSCAACGASWTLDGRGFLREGEPGAGGSVTPSVPEVASIRDWDLWQLGEFSRRLSAFRSAGPGAPAFLEDREARIYRGSKMANLRLLGTGDLSLEPGRLVLSRDGVEIHAFSVGDLTGIGVLKRNQLEFYRERDLYQVRFRSRSVSARKWALALEYLAGALGGVGAGQD